MALKLYVGSLAYSTTEDEVDLLFSDFGTVESVELVKDRFSGQSKGFGFVEMRSNAEADKAIKGLNGKLFQGRTIKVNQVQPKAKSKKGPRRR
jgi:RNA recognition motif-containing protein